MFKNVIVGVDDGQGGRDAIALARQLVDPGALLTLGSDGRAARCRSRRVRSPRWSTPRERGARRGVLCSC
jgi:hypothetical protein